MARRKTKDPWKSRIVSSGTIDPSEIVNNPLNWRKHTDYQRGALIGAMDDVGWVKPVIVNKRSGNLVDGHLRVELALAKGMKEIPVLYVDLSDAEEKEVLATLDPIGALAKAHKDITQKLFASVNSKSETLSELLRSVSASAGLVLDRFHASQASDDVPALPLKAKTKLGDLIVLGPHRLLCGDASDLEQVKQLLDGNPIHLVNTDPPYNVKVEPRSNNAIASGMKSTKGNVPAKQRERVRSHMAGRNQRLTSKTKHHHQRMDVTKRPGASIPTGEMRARDREIDNDFLTDDEFLQLLRVWFANIAWALEPGRSFYIWGGYANMSNMPLVIEEAGLYFSQAIIWHKQWPVRTRKDFMGDHEWAFYGWKKGAAHYFAPGIRNAADVWAVKKVSPQAMVHLTEKPVELAERAITYSSKSGENVLDLFAGSGSTLIAAERTERKAFLMELDPAYCDVIVERWQKYSGKKAEGWRGNGKRRRTQRPRPAEQANR